MASFRKNPRLKAELAADPKFKAALRTVGQDVADEAERNGRAVSSSYTTTVEDEDDHVRVLANTDGLNAAAWIELGTRAPTPTPACAPLRRAAEQAGLKTTGGKR